MAFPVKKKSSKKPKKFNAKAYKKMHAKVFGTAKGENTGKV